MAYQDQFTSRLIRYGARVRYKELANELAELVRRFPELSETSSHHGTNGTNGTNGTVTPVAVAVADGLSEMDGRKTRGVRGPGKKKKKDATVSEKMRDLWQTRTHKTPNAAKKTKPTPPPADTSDALEDKGEGIRVEFPTDYGISDAVLMVISEHPQLTAREIGGIVERSKFKNTSTNDIPRLVGVTLPRLAKDKKAVRGTESDRGKVWELTEKGVKLREEATATA